MKTQNKIIINIVVISFVFISLGFGGALGSIAYIKNDWKSGFISLIFIAISIALAKLITLIR